MSAPIFISYSSKDQQIAETIYQALEARGHDCWIACRDVRPGENFQEAIVRALRSAVHSAGFAKAHTRISNIGVLTGGPGHAEGLPITPAWPKIVALMDRNVGPVLRGARPATALTADLTPKVDEVLRAS